MDRSNKNGVTNGKGGNNHDDSDPTDNQLLQFVPDIGVVNNSAGNYCLKIALRVILCHSFPHYKLYDFNLP